MSDFAQTIEQTKRIAAKSTIPKFQVHNMALLSASKELFFEEAITLPADFGYVVESSVGTHLIAQANKYANVSLYYWRDGNLEIDYVVIYGKQILGIEVKSGDESIGEKTARKFKEAFPRAKLLLVGRHGIPYETFMKTELPDLFAGL